LENLDKIQLNQNSLWDNVYKIVLRLKGMKIKVVWFFALLVFVTALLAVLHFSYFGGVTGFSVLSEVKLEDLNRLDKIGRGGFGAEILDYRVSRDRIVVAYSLEEYAGEDHEIRLDYSLVDDWGLSRVRGQELVVLGARDSSRNLLEIEMPEGALGDFDLTMKLSDGSFEEEVEGRIRLETGDDFLEYVVSGASRIRPSLIGLIIFTFVVLFFVVRFISGYHVRSENLNVPSERRDMKRLIEFEVD